MRHGTVCFDFKKLWAEAENKGWYTSGLLYRHFPTPRPTISEKEWDEFFFEWEVMTNKLDTEATRSELPDEYDGYEICNTLLRGLRIQNLKELLK